MEFYFPFHIWDVILPIDELIFFKMVKTTNQHWVCLKNWVPHSIHWSSIGYWYLFFPSMTMKKTGLNPPCSDTYWHIQITTPGIRHGHATVEPCEVLPCSMCAEHWRQHMEEVGSGGSVGSTSWWHQWGLSSNIEDKLDEMLMTTLMIMNNDMIMNMIMNNNHHHHHHRIYLVMRCNA